MIEHPRSYVYAELWKAKPSWTALSTAERAQFFNERINPLLGSLVQSGADILACAINDNTSDERADYRYMCVWRFPDTGFYERLERGAKAAGFLEYFTQVNFSGAALPPDALNNDMVALAGE